MDDNALLKDSLSFLSKISNASKAFTEGVFAHRPDVPNIYYRPMQTISYMLDVYISGDSMFMYHFTNVFLHFINISLIYFLLIEYGAKKIFSFSASLIFLCHPALSGAVSWIPGRVDILLSIFSLSSFLFFIKTLKKGSLRNYLLHITFFSLALFTKETAIILSLIFVLYFICLKISNRKEEGGFIKINLSKNQIFGIILSWLTMSIIYLLERKTALPESATSGLISEVFPNFLRNLSALFLYLGKAFLPFHLSSYPTTEDINLWYGYVSIFILIILFLSTEKNRIFFFLFSALWFFLFLLPSLSSAYSYLPESRLYLPLTGFLFMGSEISPRLFLKRFLRIKPLEEKNIREEERNEKSLFSNPYLWFVAVLGICILFAILCYKQSNKYKNDLVFWTHSATESSEFPLIHMRLGEAYRRAHLDDKAEKEFMIAYKINQDLPFLRQAMASLYIEQKKLSEAENIIENGGDLNYLDALYNDLAIAYKNAGRTNEAIVRWKKAIDINPEFIEAYISLASSYFYQNKYDEAIWLCKETIKKMPSNRNAYQMLIDIYTTQGLTEQADFYKNEAAKQESSK